MKLHIVFGTSETFESVADAKAMEFAMAQINRIKGTDQELQVNTSTYAVILAFRVLVKEGVLSHKDILFYTAKHPITSDLVIDKSTFDYPIRIDKNGTTETHPDIFDTHTNFYFRLL